jgi:arsenite methyltransferase
MFKQVKPENVAVYLRKIDSLFPEFRAKREVTPIDVKRYYLESYWGYALFHSWAGAIHMALSRDGAFSKNDYFRQVEEVSELVADCASHKVRSVLEIGCGRGFNIYFLAQKFKDKSFVGVDISERNLRSARTQISDLRNVSLYLSDFHSLLDVEDRSTDIVFAVESLCHAMDMEQALKAIARVLVKGGKFVVFDGFRRNFVEHPEIVQKAVIYSEKAMAVPMFREVDGIVVAAEKFGLCCVQMEDRSNEIMPNLMRLSDLAKMFFKIDPLSHVIKTILPRGLVLNSVAGLLMAVTVQKGAHRYYKITFLKKEE